MSDVVNGVRGGDKACLLTLADRTSKFTIVGTVTDEKVQYVQDLLNNRPRKVLNYLTPNEIVNKHLTKAYKKFSQLT